MHSCIIWRQECRCFELRVSSLSCSYFYMSAFWQQTNPVIDLCFLSPQVEWIPNVRWSNRCSWRCYCDAKQKSRFLNGKLLLYEPESIVFIGRCLHMSSDHHVSTILISDTMWMSRLYSHFDVTNDQPTRIKRQNVRNYAWHGAGLLEASLDVFVHRKTWLRHHSGMLRNSWSRSAKMFSSVAAEFSVLITSGNCRR